MRELQRINRLSVVVRIIDDALRPKIRRVRDPQAARSTLSISYAIVRPSPLGTNAIGNG
jgi:hypothetical protein